MRTEIEWICEATNFLLNFRRYNDHEPSLDDVITELRIDANDEPYFFEMMMEQCDTIEEYAEKLYSYMK